MTALDRLTALLFRNPVWPTSSLPVPATSKDRITSDELSALEEHWKAERDRAGSVLADDYARFMSGSDCVACNPNGGRRPETREGREGR